MADPIFWRVQEADVALAAYGEHSEDFSVFVKSHLVGDFYSSLESTREVFLTNSDFEEVEFCLCIAERGVLYALLGGGAVLWLKRDGAKTPLLKTLKKTASLVTGHIKAGDAFEMEVDTIRSTFSPEMDNRPGDLVENDGIRQKVVDTIDKLLDRFPERKIVVHGAETDRSRKASIIGVMFIFALAISVYFGIQRRAEIARREEYEPKLMAASHDFEEARELSSVSRARARELILRAYQSTKELKDSGVKDEALDELAVGISSYLGSIAGIYEVAANVFFDLTLIASGFEGVDIALSSGRISVLDSAGKRLVGLEVESRRTGVIAGPEYLPDALATASYEGRSFILSSDGIREVTGEVSLVVKPDWDADNILFEAFAGNLYVLDRENNQVWRYSGFPGGFSEKEAWLGEGFNKDTTQAVAMAIDGAIWTISREGEFKAYSLGAPARFSVVGNPQPFGDVVDLYTTEASNFIYVLDKGESRISIVAKRGEYVGEYIAPEIGGADAFVVDEESGLIFFLAESKLYSIEAKHLENSDENN
jgi:hypothetical protein